MEYTGCAPMILGPNRSRRCPYRRSEVIHRAGGESAFLAFEREQPRIVNNFARTRSFPSQVIVVLMPE
jgi:hypothetical protein